MAKRFDLSRLARSTRLAGGAVAIPARLTRTGVFVYQDSTGAVRRELRPAEEVFRPDSLATLRYATVTDLHPEAPVDAANWRAHAIGTVGAEVKQDGEFVASEIVVYEQSAIAKIDSGERKELSCGYDCDIDPQGGSFNGETYDCIQRNIRYNHVAIGPEGWGRAGSQVAMRLDSGDAFARIPESVTSNERKGRTMKRSFVLDGITWEVDADEGFFQMLGRMFKHDSDKVVALTKERDEATARADAAEAELKKSKDGFDTAVAAKVAEQNAQTAMRADARKLVASDYHFDGKADRDIMVDAIRTVDDSFDPKDRSDDYIRSRFDLAVESKANKTSGDSKSALDGAAGSDNRNDGLAKAQDAFYKNTFEAWKQPLAVTNS